MRSIDNAYVNWLKSRFIYNKFKGMSDSYTIEKIISRHILTNINDTGTLFKSNATQMVKFKTEIKQMGLSDIAQRTVIELFDPLLLDLVESKYLSSKRPQLIINENHRSFTFGEYIHVVRPDVWSRMEGFSYEDIVISLMLYSAMGNSSNQWCITLDEYKGFIDDHSMMIEGFATPFHSQLIKIDPKYRFCSAFEEDKKLGSMGSFFDCDFNDKVVITNPPFVESILLMVAQKCQDQLSSNKVKFIVRCPHWEDSEFYSILSKSEYLIDKTIHQKGKYFYEDTSGRRILANFNSVTFYLESK